MKFVAADIGGTSTKICISDENGRIEQFQEYDTESEKGGIYVINKLIRKIGEFRDFDAIAISTAGQVNPDEGYIVYANENIPGYTGTRIKDILTEEFRKPVKVENDVNAAALGEGYFGAGRLFRDFLCLTYGTGIGGAIVIDRRIYRGAEGVAGEFGHIITHASAGNGERAHFYEKYASTTALVRNAMLADPECVNGKIIFDKIDRGDLKLERVLEQWVNDVAIGLVSFVHIFNPSAIIVGGGVMEQERLVDMVERRTKELVMESFANVKLVKASLGNKAGVLGAVSLYLQKAVN